MCGRFHSVYTLAPLAWTFLHVREKKEAKLKSTKRRKKKTFFSRGEKKKDREEEMLTEEKKKSESGIVVLAFHHRNDNDDPSSPFYSMSPTPGFILNETPSGLNSAWQG